MKQDATGGHELTWDAAYKFGDTQVPALSSRANAEDVFLFRYLSGEMRLVAANTGF